MPKGDNKVTINFTTEMKQFGDSKKGDLYLSFFTALAFLERYREEFIAKYGQEIYEAHVKRYSIPAVEVRNNSTKRKKEALEQRKRELELREKELDVKSKFLEAETERMNDKHEDRTEEKDRKAKLSERVRRPSEDEKTLSILENYQLTPEQLKDGEFMAKHNKRITELREKIAQSKP